MLTNSRAVSTRSSFGSSRALPLALLLMAVAVGLPVIAAAGGEQTLSGRIEFDHADDFQGSRAERFTMLDTGDDRLELVGADPETLRPGMRVKARGHRQGSKFTLSADDGALTAAGGDGEMTSSGGTTTAAATSSTEKRIAVLLVNFVAPTPSPTPTPPPTPAPSSPPPTSTPSPPASSGASSKPSAVTSPSSSPSPSSSASPSASPSPSPTPTPPPEPWTKAEVKSLYFTGTRSVASYYAELSNGRMSVTGDVFGYYTVTTQTKTCDYSTWGTLARTAATEAGVDLSTYTNVVYAFPQQKACWWYGLANLPGRNSWINGQMSLYVTSHELGHNFGVDHAAALTCTRNGSRVSYSSSCSADEYGDPYDVMGYTGQRHMSNWHRYKIGFLSSSDIKTVTTGAHGLYRVAPAQVDGGGPRILRVARTEGDYYYLEFRQPYGEFDNFASTSSVVNGVLIRVAPSTATVKTRLIDAVPSTSTFGDATLTVGNTFHDPVNTIYVTVVAVSSAGTDVHIQAGPDVVVPSTPTNLVATTNGTGGISLSWTAARDDVIVTGYDVYRNGVKIKNVTGTSFFESGLPQGVTYDYAVHARDRSNAGAPATVSVYLPDTTPPGAPVSLTATQTAPRTAFITWQPAIDNVGVTAYRVFRGTSLLGTVTGTSFVDNSAPDGVISRYRVRALDAAGNVGIAAITDLALSDTIAPTLGGTLAATVDSSSAVNLSWTPATDNVGVTRYSIFRNGIWVADSPTAAWRDATVAPLRTHTYSVRAFDAAGNQSATIGTSIYVPDLTPPSPPANVSAVLSSSRVARLTWSAAADNVGAHHYVVARDGVVVAETTTLGPIDVAVAEGRTYQFTVRAVDAAGNTGLASAASLAVPDVTPPSAVPSFTATATSSTSVALNWSAASDNVGVTAYRIARNGLVLASLANGARSYTDSSLASDRSYTYSVVPLDAAGNLGPAASATVTLASVDTTAPAPPTNVRGESLGDREVLVRWTRSTDDDGTVKYRVFRNGVRVATVRDAKYLDRPSSVGTYSYRLKAVDAAGNVSAFSSTFSIFAAR